MRIAVLISVCVSSVALLIARPASAQLEAALGGATGDAAEESDGAAAPASQEALDPAARARLDDRIETQLRAIISQVEELEGVEVVVDRGVVHLDGEVASAESRERARGVASSLDGVLYVDDGTEVATEVGDRVGPTIGRARQRLDEFVERLPLFALALGLVLVAWLLARALSSFDLPFRAVSKHRLVRGVVRQFFASAIVIAAVVLALELLDATALVGAVLGAAGLAGLALGLAFRGIAENYLASILLSLRRPFAVDDFVRIGDEHEGVVVRLTTRDTVLMTLDGNHLRLPNSLVYASTILNFTHNSKRRFSFVVGIGNDEDLLHAIALGIGALRDMPSVLPEPAPFALIESLAPSNVEVRFHAWMDQRKSDWLRTQSEGIRRVKKALDDAGVEMPVPIQRIEVTRERPPTEGTQRTIAAPSAALAEEIVDVDADDGLAAQLREEHASTPEENLLR